MHAESWTGLFFPLPTTRPAEVASGTREHRHTDTGTDTNTETDPPYTHMLQSDFPGHADGTAFYALGVYDESKGACPAENLSAYGKHRVAFSPLAYFPVIMKWLLGRCRRV